MQRNPRARRVRSRGRPARERAPERGVRAARQQPSIRRLAAARQGARRAARIRRNAYRIATAPPRNLRRADESRPAPHRHRRATFRSSIRWQAFDHRFVETRNERRAYPRGRSRRRWSAARLERREPDRPRRTCRRIPYGQTTTRSMKRPHEFSSLVFSAQPRPRRNTGSYACSAIASRTSASGRRVERRPCSAPEIAFGERGNVGGRSEKTGVPGGTAHQVGLLVVDESLHAPAPPSSSVAGIARALRCARAKDERTARIFARARSSDRRVIRSIATPATMKPRSL